METITDPSPPERTAQEEINLAQAEIVRLLDTVRQQKIVIKALQDRVRNFERASTAPPGIESDEGRQENIVPPVGGVPSGTDGDSNG